MSPLRPLATLLALAFLAVPAMASASTNADLAVSNSPKIDGDTSVGSTATYLIQVTNNGPDDANVTFSDQLGDAEQLVMATPDLGTCTQAPPVTCSLGDLAAGGVANVQLRIKYTKTGANQNTYQVSGADNADPDPNNDIGGVGFTVGEPQPADAGNTPAVETGYAAQYGQAHIDVEGQIAPYGSGTWWIEYGKTKSYGEKTAAKKISSQRTVKVQGTFDGLDIDTTYHYRLVLEVGGKTYRGVDRSAKTLGVQKYADLRMKAVKRGATSTTYVGGFKDADLLDAPHACRGSVTMEVYTTSNQNLLLRKTRMNESDCTFRITIPFGTTQARRYGKKGTVLAQAFFGGSSAIAHVGTSGDHI